MDYKNLYQELKVDGWVIMLCHKKGTIGRDLGIIVEDKDIIKDGEKEALNTVYLRIYKLIKEWEDEVQKI